MTAKKVLVILAPGAEEMDTVISVDRRGGLAEARGRGPYTCMLHPFARRRTSAEALALGASKEV